MRRLLFTILVLALFPGCAAILPDAKRIEVQQGNVLTEKDIGQLHDGLSRDRVRELIGSPVLRAPFHGNRWDYVYYRTEAGRDVAQRQRLTLYFERDQVTRIVDHYQPPDDVEGQPLARQADRDTDSD